MATQVFVSYSHSDMEFAGRLVKDLEQAGYEAWLDRTDIQTGARWDDEIVRGLDSSEIFLVILSNKSTNSQNVKDEIGYALDHNKQILPLLIEPCEVPFRLRRIQYVDFTALKYREGIESVLQIIKSFSTKGKGAAETVKPAAEKKSQEEKNMPGKKGAASRNTAGDKISISITGNSNVAAAGRGAHATLNQSGSNSELDEWRKQMERKINALKDFYPEDKSALNQQVEQIAREVEKGAQADASRVERLINTIAAMAPDIFEVAVATLVNPLAGIGLAARKIGDKAQVRKV